MTTRAPVEAKVIGGLVGTGAGGILGTFVVWLLGVLAWHASSTADHASAAVAAVPAPVSALVVVGIAAIGQFIGGYVAPHTPRPAPVPVTPAQ